MAGVVLRYKEFWGDQESQNDVLSIAGTNVCVPVLCPIDKRVNAVFFSDRHADGRTDLSAPHPVFDALPFVVGVDIFVPAAAPPTGTAAVELRSRGGGPVRTVNFPNFASATDVVTVQLNDFERLADGGRSECLRPARIAFKLHRWRHARVVRVKAFVNGKRVARRRGHDIKRITLRGLPRTGKMRIRIVATHSSGSKLVSTRTWRGCEKGKPRVRRVGPR